LTSTFRPTLLNGVVVLDGRARALAADAKGGVTSTEQRLIAIPYATWANRGPGEMIVWLPRTDAGAHPTPAPTLATSATITASVPTEGRGKSLRPIADGEAPRTSDDPSSYFDWWPTRGSAREWVEMTLAAPARVSEASVYWFDDTGHGGVRVPASWRILYKDAAGAWTPVQAAEAYGVARDRFNRVTFAPVTAAALRIEIVMQPTFSVGLQEWAVK
ncbi:MAG: glycoside hydrolase family 127 protein, partial [Vicinamibacteraceae bacterium]